jgi:hypothetical protein
MTSDTKPENRPEPLDRETYCRRLGHFVPFRYCLKPAQDSPCFKVLDCWWQIFDVESYLCEQLSEDEFKEIASANPAPNKLESLLDVVSRIKTETKER